MQKSIYRLVFSILIMVASVNARSQEVKYYTLVIDKIDLPYFTNDTTASGVLRLYISFDEDRTIDLMRNVSLTSKPAVLTINEKIPDIKRENKLTFWMKFLETGAKQPATTSTTGSMNINNLVIVFNSSFSAISEGRRTFAWDKKETWYTSVFYKDRNDGPSATLYWHLEPSKLQ